MDIPKHLHEAEDLGDGPSVESNLEGELHAEVVAKLKTVFDPEIPVDIYELGLIYGFFMNTPGRLELRMTLTSPMCPVAGTLPFEIKQKLETIDAVEEADIELTFEPPWSKDRMSEEARLELDMF
jgi:FeS assembly SUF system protein